MTHDTMDDSEHIKRDLSKNIVNYDRKLVGGMSMEIAISHQSNKDGTKCAPTHAASCEDILLL